MKTIILAGGFGTRLREVVNDVPKPMAMIAGKPFLEHQINFLKNQGLEDMVLCVHYMSDKIKSYFGDGFRGGVNITYSDEETPLGTAGAIKLAERYVEGSFLVLNGDSYSDVDIKNFLNFHELKRKEEYLGSFVMTNIGDISQYGSVLVRGDKITGFSEKGGEGQGMINAGIYMFEPEIFEYIPSGKKMSLEEELLPSLATQNKLTGYVHEGYFMDIGRPETYNQFKRDFLRRLQSRDNISVREAMRIMGENRTDVLLITTSDGNLSGVVNDEIIRKFLVAGGQVEQKVSEAMVTKPERIGRISDGEDQIYSLLSAGTRHLPILDEQGKVCDIRFRNEEINERVFPTIRGKSPLRISFAGGGTDLPYFFEEWGGAVISSTIDRYCHVTAQKRADHKVIIESREGGGVFDSRNLEYNGEFDLLKAVFNIVNPNFGVDLYLSNDVPPERGLGSSASFAVLMGKILMELKGAEYDDQGLAEIAYRAEVNELGIRGGKQDQYASVFGGFNWMEFEKGDKKIIHPLRLKEDTVDELKEHLTLCYTGLQHNSGVQHEKQEASFRENNSDVVKRLNRFKEIAVEIKENLLSARPNFVKVGELLHESWQYKRKLTRDSPGKIDVLYESGRNMGAYGGKLLGSGGGGYILFMHPPKKKNQLERSLEEKGGEVLDFNFESRGVKVWYVNK